MPKARRSSRKITALTKATAERMAESYAELIGSHYLKHRKMMSYRVFSILVAERHPERRLYDQSTVATWILYGQRPDDAETQLAIAEALGVNPSWLWFGAGPKRPAGPEPSTEAAATRSLPKKKKKKRRT